MAASLGSQAIPALTYVDRIVDIPIGIVAVSLGSVLMPMMSRSAAAGKGDEIAETLAYSLRMMWFATLPVAALVMFFHNNMLHILCLGGRYTMADLQAAHWVAVFYGVGIPFFCSLKVIYPAFYARQKMVTVLKVSVCATMINIVMNYILMQFLAQGGIALATVISSLFNNGVLLWLLKKENITRHAGAVFLSFVRSMKEKKSMAHKQKPLVIFWALCLEVRDMTNRQLLEDLDYVNLIVFENPDYDAAIIGVSHDDRVIYDYDKMVACLMDEDDMSSIEAADFISYNTIRALPYAGANAPIIMFGLQ